MTDWTRRDFLRLLAAGSAVAALPGPLPGQSSNPRPTRPPNIVLILADDLGYECLSANGCTQYRTPALDRLAGEGVRFTNCHSQPLCTPSRVQLMTGRYNSRNYIRFGVLDYRERTFAHALKAAGYATCVVGKWQLNASGLEDEKIPPVKLPAAAGFDEHCLWQLRKRGSRYWNPVIEQNGQWLDADKTRGKYGPDIFCDYACDFVARKKDQPFLLYWPMCLTHDPFEPPPGSTNGGGQANFKSMVEYMDKLVGRLVARLDELDLRDDTLILFVGDNGTHPSIRTQTRSGVVVGGKQSVLTTATHVPLIANWQGRSARGRVCADLVDFSDFLPTLLEAAAPAIPPAGQKSPATAPDPAVPATLDGRSFLPQILGQPGRPRQWIYCYYTDMAGKFHSRHARDARYKLYGNGRLYDTQADPLEKSPLPLDDAATRDVRARLAAAVEQMAATELRPVPRAWLSPAAPQPPAR